MIECISHDIDKDNRRCRRCGKSEVGIRAGNRVCIGNQEGIVRPAPGADEAIWMELEKTTSHRPVVTDEVSIYGNAHRVLSSIVDLDGLMKIALKAQFENRQRQFATMRGIQSMPPCSACGERIEYSIDPYEHYTICRHIRDELKRVLPPMDPSPLEFTPHNLMGVPVHIKA